ncbi:myosin heavy chain, clone 203-like [Argopecten irradians]|uniref:myosin heavy chain, clone 203-like n=1 Tax=Argopecten irradians TaxID=31199 RepID=UPI00371E36E1
MYEYSHTLLDSGGESDNSPGIRRCWNNRNNHNNRNNQTIDDIHLYRMDNYSDEGSEYEEEFRESDLQNVRAQIKKAEREKAKLEKQISEKHVLEERLKEVSRSVSDLKSVKNSGNVSVASTSRHGNGDKNNRGNNSRHDIPSSSGGGVVDMLKEQREKLNRLTNRRGDAGSTRQEVEDHEQVTESEEEQEEEDSKNLDKVMSLEHKMKLQQHRDTLVESLIPDDILNDLIANKVLLIGDVSRIKEKNTQEAMNEELLNNLGRRSDRAFYVFVKSLRKTLQGYLADLIDEPVPKPVPRKSKRKRKKAELNVSVDCESVLPLPKKKPQCSCQEVEEQILLMARTAYSTIRRRDHTPAAFEQFKKELSQTNDIIKDTAEIMHTLKILCKHGDDISDISYGSVKFTMCFKSVENVVKLWDMYRSGALLDLLQRGLVTKALLRKCQARDVKLRVRIPEEEYIQCVKDLESNELPEKCKKSTPTYSRVLRSAKQVTDRVLDNCTTRYAFREIQRNITSCRDDGGMKTRVAECEKVPVVSSRKRLLFGTRLRSAVS